MSDIIRRTRFELVLELWHRGDRSTDAIAAELGIAEREVCEILDQGEGAPPRVGRDLDGCEVRT